MKKLCTLFLTFLKIGAFTFGGGYAMIALLEHELIEKKGWIGHDEFIAKKKWIDKKEFLDMIAIAESTPGPIAINSATYIGYHIAGVPGAATATLGVCIPSFVIIYLISLFFDQFLSLKFVSCAFRGIQVCVVYLIFSAGVRMLKSLEKTAFNTVLVTGVAVCMIAFSVFAVSFSSIYFILLSGVVGLAAYFIQRLRGKGGDVK